MPLVAATPDDDSEDTMKAAPTWAAASKTIEVGETSAASTHPTLSGPIFGDASLPVKSVHAAESATTLGMALRAALRPPAKPKPPEPSLPRLSKSKLAKKKPKEKDKAHEGA